MAEPRHTIVSGIQPSGPLHIANYAGAVRNWVELQEKYDCLYFIADYHQMSGDYDPRANRRLVLELAADLLAAGLDPKRCTLFVQSDVPEHTELFWILNTVTPIAELERMTQFKDKSRRQAQNVNAGLFEYPVLQAADILIYFSDRVPVGRDQVQHVELARDIARRFNNRFGRTFPEPQPLLTDTPKLRSLTDPLKKMSKSLGERSYVALSDGPEDILAKVKRAVTESSGELSMSETELEKRMAALEPDTEPDEQLRGLAGAWNLIALLRLFGKAGEAERVVADQPIRYSELKELVARRLTERFADFREKRAELLKNPKQVEKILAGGAKKARGLARKNLSEIRKRVGLD